MLQYGSIVCKPKNNNLDAFNVWVGYKAKRLEVVDETLIKPILNFIYEVWAGSNNEIYQYLLTWMHYLLAKPELKTRICLFAHSISHGAGKNTFIVNVGKNCYQIVFR